MKALERLLVVVIMSSLAVVAAAAPATAAPGWNPPLEGAERTSHAPEQPRVGLDAAGTAAMAWTRFDPDSGVRVLETRIVPADGPSGPAIQLSAPGASAGAFDIAVAPDGRAVVVWGQSDQIMASVRPPGGAFGPGQALSKPAGESAVAAVVELDAAGNATVLWTTRQGAAWRTRTTTIAAGAVNGPTTLIHLEATAQLSEPALAVDPTGRAHGVWVRAQVSGGDRTTTVQRAYRAAAGGGFAYQGDLDSFVESPYNMEAPGGLRAPRVAVDRDGRAVAAWMRSGFPSIVRWSAGPAGGAWAPAATLGGEATAGAPLLAMSPAGDALIAGTSAAAPRKLWIARRPAGGTFGGQETVADDSVHVPSDLAVGASGATVLTWLTLDGGDYRARAAHRARIGAPWVETALGTTSPSLYSGTLLPTAALNAGGHAAVAWSAGTPDTFHTLLARYEVVQPVGPGAGPGAAPVVSGLRMKPRRFAVGGRRGAGKRRVKRGSTLRFRLSERARVRIRIDRVQRGRRAGGRCRPAAQSGRRCVRLRRVGTLVRRGRPAGVNRIRFRGRIGRRALRPGRYRATVVAIDAAGNRSKPRRVAFRIVRAR